MPFNADYHVECVLPRGLLSVPVYQLEVDVYVVSCSTLSSPWLKCMAV